MKTRGPEGEGNLPKSPTPSPASGSADPACLLTGGQGTDRAIKAGQLARASGGKTSARAMPQRGQWPLWTYSRSWPHQQCGGIKFDWTARVEWVMGVRVIVF